MNSIHSGFTVAGQFYWLINAPIAGTCAGCVFEGTEFCSVEECSRDERDCIVIPVSATARKLILNQRELDVAAVRAAVAEARAQEARAVAEFGREFFPCVQI